MYTVPYVGVFDDDEMPLRRIIVASNTLEDALNTLREMGITHILVNQFEMKRLLGNSATRTTYLNLPAEKEKMVSDFFSPRYMRLLNSQYDVLLYEILL